MPFVISIVANEENDAFARTQGGLRRRDLWSNDGWLNIGHHYYHHKSWSHNTITSSHQRARVQSLLVASRRRQVGHLAVAVTVVVVTGGQGMGGKTPRARSLGPSLQASPRKASPSQVGPRRVGPSLQLQLGPSHPAKSYNMSQVGLRARDVPDNQSSSCSWYL